MYYKSPSVELSFEGHFNVSGNGGNTAYLRLLHPEHSAEYFGAASYHFREEQLLPLTKTRDIIIILLILLYIIILDTFNSTM